MVPLASLWLPILLSAVVVFVASSLLHMVLTYHNSDFARLPNEDAVADALRSAPVGDYMVPHAASAAQRKEPAFQEKMKRGPVAVMTVMGTDMQKMLMRSLAFWFVYAIVVSVFGAYIGGRALGPGAEYLDVFRFVGTTTFLGYALASAQNSIWWGRKWSATIKSMVDGLIYALLTAGVFGWLWPV